MGHTVLPYTAYWTDTWDALKTCDVDPSNSANVKLLYSDLSVDADQETVRARSAPVTRTLAGGAGSWVLAVSSRARRVHPVHARAHRVTNGCARRNEREADRGD